MALAALPLMADVGVPLLLAPPPLWPAMAKPNLDRAPPVLPALLLLLALAPLFK